MRALSRLLCSAWLMSCAGGAGAGAEPEAATAAVGNCQRTLEPRPALPPPVPSGNAKPEQAAPSQLIVEARLPLARLTAELERSVAPRLAEERALRIGPAGRLEYEVERGAFAVSVADGVLRIEAPLEGRAQACSGSRCYASCEPQALARAELPLWLRPDYRFAGTRVSLEITRGCKVRALGGLLRVDVTPMLRSALAPQIERIRREIDARLPEPRAEAERAWRQLTEPRPLPLGGCAVLDPVGLVQGPMAESGGVLHARFALLARPELRRECAAAERGAAAAEAAAERAPLPPLEADPALPAEGSLALGMELPLAQLAEAFEAAQSRDGVRVTAAKVAALGTHISAELELAGALCGALALRAEPLFGGEGELTLGSGELARGEAERVRALGLDPAALARQLTQLPRVAPPLSLPLLRAAAPALTALFSHPELRLVAELSALRAAGAAARGEHVAAWVEARGRLVLEPR